MRARRRSRTESVTVVKDFLHPIITHATARLARGALALACALVIVCGAPSPAWAETRTSDVVCGATALERAIPASALPDISAASAIVVTPEGETRFERDADTPRKIASITKVMTAIVALDHATPETVITVDHAAATVGEASAGLREGETLTFEDALKALLIPSGNDAAMAIATSVGALIDPASTDPYVTFVDAMNAKAAELGCTDTTFENPHGLDFDAWAGELHSTARDVARMIACAMQNELFRATVALGDCDIPLTTADGSVRTAHLRETNAILGTEGNIGVKTGTTEEAGLCFAGAFTDDEDGTVYTVVLGCPPAEEGAEDPRFADTLTLARWWREHERHMPAVTSEAATADGTPIAARVSHADWTDKTVDAVAESPDETFPYFDLAGEVEATFDAPACIGDVHVGDELGTITYRQDDQELGVCTLVAAEDVPAPDPFAWVMVQLDRLVRLVTGEPAAAPTVELAQVPAAAPEDAASADNHATS